MQVRGEGASKAALTPEPGVEMGPFECKPMCLESCKRSGVQGKCLLQLGRNSLSHFLSLLLSSFIISLVQLLTWW